MTDDYSKVGTYTIFYRMLLQRFPETYKDFNDPFTITVPDPCAGGTLSVTAVDLEDQEYTIGDEALEYHIPEFSAEPSICKINYRFNIVDSKGETAANFDHEARIFIFESEDDFELAGETYEEYTVIITGEVGSDQIESDSAQFKLHVENPCTLIVPDQEGPP